MSDIYSYAINMVVKDFLLVLLFNGLYRVWVLLQHNRWLVLPV